MSRGSARNRVFLALAIALLAGAALGGVVAKTTANWTDEVNFEAQATAGTWEIDSAWECYSIEPNPPPEQTCSIDPSSATSWQVSQNWYMFMYNVKTSYPTPFRWEVRFNLDDEVVYQGGPILSTGGTPGVALFPGPEVPGAPPNQPPWTPVSYQLVNTCAASGASPPVVRVQGVGGQYGSTFVSASNPERTRYLQIHAYAAGHGGSTWGSGLAPTCGLLDDPDPQDTAILCYRAGFPYQTDCSVNIELWDPLGYLLEWTVVAPGPVADPFTWEIRFDLSKTGHSTSKGEVFTGTVPEFLETSGVCVVWGHNDEPPEAFLPIVRVRGLAEDTALVTPGGQPVEGMSVERGDESLSDMPKCPALTLEAP